MRIHPLAPLLIGLSLAAVTVGCGSKSAPTTTDPALSTAPGTPVKQPLGVSSAGGVSSSRPAAPR